MSDRKGKSRQLSAEGAPASVSSAAASLSKDGGRAESVYSADISLKTTTPAGSLFEAEPLHINHDAADLEAGPSQSSTLHSSNGPTAAWDDSDDEDDDSLGISRRFLTVKRPGDDSDDDERIAARGRGAHKGAAVETSRTLHGYEEMETRDYSNLQSLLAMLPSRVTLRRWWSNLTSNPSQPASLSISTVSINLFSTSLHPAVLMSLPFYFSRTGILLGTIGLAAVAVLGGVGGGLWVVLGRYVNANNVENIVGAGCARNSRWRSELGRTLTGLLLGTYATGSAFIAYFAAADLLLQVFFHYSPRGIPLHDRAFVTLVVGGFFTTPLLVFPFAKRTLIRLNSGLTLVLYPLLLAILFSKIYTWSEETVPSTVQVVVPDVPNANPFQPPSIWAPYSLLPLLTLSSSPLQIMQHQRSLRRKGLSGGNVKAFIAAQTLQVLAVIGMSVAFGVGIGLKGMQERLDLELRPNLFTTLPKDDDTLNFARVLFVLLLSSHLALCVVTARSSWSRILRRFKLNPLRRRRKVHMSSAGIETSSPAPPSAPSQQARQREVSRDTYDDGNETGAEGGHTSGGSAVGSPSLPFRDRARLLGAKIRKAPRRWAKPARNALAGLILWAVVAGAAYTSGNGRLRRGAEKEGEEARFTRASEVLGLMGAGVGFVLPSLVWVVLFWIRSARTILPVSSDRDARDLERRPLLPRTALGLDSPGAGAGSGARAEREGDDRGHWHASVQAVPTQQSARLGGAHDSDDEDAGHRGEIFRAWVREDDAAHRDAQTAILLARKERQMQKNMRRMRRWQDLLVLGGVLPLGIALILLGAVELSAGGF